MSTPPPPSRFAPYRNALAALSERTGAHLPSLIFSFAVLHELTAIVPLVGVFFVARGLGVGEQVVNHFARPNHREDDQPAGYINRQLSQWVDGGEQWAGRVGRRYGIFGFKKGQPANRDDTQQVSGKLAGDVANAVLAYGAVKALMPVRIGLSLYLSPAFSRRIVEPIRLKVIQPFRRRKS
ncbi:hypothetical protein PAXRUDRAFT_142157 [Paxillus rubicundulus Ve08.2h10]|uniref:Uncharacterized protein n=1 Tax=Paxillus rubicundulus Ve08.2h10 TaxID=930991 RepID=A0A0D0DQL6_9AGAM|nr:hypothetical protein PAXRUDRAFT_142157 [Paxillus rubicundulus Ve08.2h10]